MGRKRIELTERDYFLLGTLAEQADGLDQLPTGCTDQQAERLARSGYLTREVLGAGRGADLVHYRITQRGQTAWQAYGFVEAPAEPGKA